MNGVTVLDSQGRPYDAMIASAEVPKVVSNSYFSLCGRIEQTLDLGVEIPGDDESRLLP